LNTRLDDIQEPCGGEVFDDDTRGRQRTTFVDSLESPVGAGPADDSLQLADRVLCLQNDVAAQTYEIEALREQASITANTDTRRTRLTSSAG